MRKAIHTIVFGLGLILTGQAIAQVSEKAQAASEPRQVILIIGDGMDDQQITIARNYLVGATGRLQLDQLPLRATSQVLTIEDKVGGKLVYVADSANTATSMATGVVTSPGRIATTAGSDEDIITIVELAEAAGYKTGIVTTASVTDATPAAFAAHINFRLCESPDLMSDINLWGLQLGNCQPDLKRNGGKGSISEQLAASGLDVILGGGRKYFAARAENSERSVRQLAEDNGFGYVNTLAGMQSARHERRLLGLFSSGKMPVAWRGEDGRVAEVLDKNSTIPTMRCEPNPKFASSPTLKQMTDSALSHLSRDNPLGFFLMIESASIDKQSHKRNPCGSIGELQQLEEALQSAMAFAQTHPRTLILVTADHGQAAQLIPYGGIFSSESEPVRSPGKVARIITPEGGILTVNYATSTSSDEEHTGVSIPLLSNAEGMGLIPAFVQQPQIFDISRKYLGL